MGVWGCGIWPLLHLTPHLAHLAGRELDGFGAHGLGKGWEEEAASPGEGVAGEGVAVMGWPERLWGRGCSVTSFCSGGRWQLRRGDQARCPGTSGCLSTLLPGDLGMGMAGWWHSCPQQGHRRRFGVRANTQWREHPMGSGEGTGSQSLPIALVWKCHQALQVSSLSSVTSQTPTL